jgi:RHS repeat-associated protein
MHRVYQAFNPSRSGDSLNFATTYAYDGLDRTLTVTTADNAVVTTSYSGNQTTVTDQASHTRVTTTDGLGRLTKVVEDPNSLNYTTTYAYDPLDDLTGVTQASESRSFGYDSLKRLTSATNPESGLISYTYDNNSNLATRTDARSRILCFGTLSGSTCTSSVGTGYDAINRPLKKSYSDSTPIVTFTYDTATLGKHRLASVANSVSTTNFTSYDPFGNVLASSQPTDGLQNSFSYTYNLASDLLAETYPSGRVVTTGYDQANRPITVSGLYSGNTTPYLTSSAAQYAPHGEMWQYQLGNDVWHQTEFNSRLQPCYGLDTINQYAAINEDSMSATTCSSAPVPSPNGVSQEVLAASFNWGTTADNGNLLGLSTTANAASLYAPVSVAQTYGYDNVNRLSTSSETAAGVTSWSRDFGYDAYGNMWVTANTGVSLNGITPTSNVYSNNRMSTNTYDASGNVTALGSSNSTALYYDAENHQNQATEPPSLGGATEYFYYDGNGRRVEKSGPAGTIVFAYDASGELAYEYNTATNPPPCTTCYLSPDHLGTPRMVTDSAANVIGWHDYLPFGEEIPSGIGGRTNFWGATNDNVNQKFTGKERDVETGLDYFGARYFSAAQGRFTGADWAYAPRPVPYANLLDPQTLNLYAYVRNNSLSLFDPNGHCLQAADNATCLGAEEFEPPAPPPQPLTDDAQTSPSPSGQGSVGDKLKAGAREVDKSLAKASDYLDDHPLLGVGIFAIGAALEQGPAEQKLEKAVPDAIEEIEKLTAEAEATYPKLAGRFNLHHVEPKYLGGAPDGELVRLNAAYHQLITNMFRQLAPYGQNIQRSQEEIKRILSQVYSKFPLPPQSGK